MNWMELGRRGCVPYQRVAQCPGFLETGERRRPFAADIAYVCVSGLWRVLSLEIFKQVMCCPPLYTPNHTIIATLEAYDHSQLTVSHST